jgi:lipopolysaccharide biosynthesis glycosyltransferase
LATVAGATPQGSVPSIEAALLRGPRERRAPEARSQGLIYIAGACNETYAMPLAVMLASLGAHLGRGRRVIAFIVERALSPQTRRKIEQSIHGTPLEINWLTLDHDRLTHLADSIRGYEWFTLEAYFRLLLPELLPPELSRIIYLDCDLLINRDLGELWDLEVGDAYVLAIGETNPHAARVSSKHGVHFYRELGLRADQRMFNSGVLVINLEAWRERSLARRVFDYVRVAGDGLSWVDQEGLNAMIAGEWREVDQRWNVTTDLHGSAPATPAAEAVLRDPFIIHFTGAAKPWHAGYSHGFQDWFLAQLDRTVWAGWRPGRSRFGSAGRLAAMSVKAVRKRHHALERHLRRLRDQVRARRVLNRPLRWLGDRPPPQRAGSEIRVFVVAEHPGQVRPEVVARHFSSGADRVVLAIPRAGPEIERLLERHARLHAVETGHDRRSGPEVLRQVLHRCGEPHWCLVVGPDQWLNHLDSGHRSLRELCTDLDGAGFDALRCQVSDGRPPCCERRADHRLDDSPAPGGSEVDAAPRLIRSIARDDLTGRVFVAQFDINRWSSSDASDVQSKIALMRYRSDWALSADLRAVAGCREADFRGVLLGLDDIGAASAITVEMEHSG